MYGTTVLQIQMTPDQFAQLIDERLTKALANFTPPAPTGAELPELMTRREVSAYLRVSLTTLHEWAKDTDDRTALLVPRHMNGRVRYRRDDVLTLQKEHRRFKNSKDGKSRSI